MQHSIRPVDLALALESSGLLFQTLDESSPLRRPQGNFDPNQFVTIHWDSRDIDITKTCSRPEWIFIARSGHRFDGHTLVEKILESGNVFIGERNKIVKYLGLTSRPAEWIGNILAHPLLILVDNSEKALRVALEVASSLKAKTFHSIAVTGTSGKTSVTQIGGGLLELILKQDILRIGTLGLQIGKTFEEGAYPTMPDFPGFISAHCKARDLGIDHVIFEATSHGLLERRMGNWSVDVAVFTNFSQDHLDFHKTMASYRAAKGILFEDHLKKSGNVVLNINDPEWIYFAHCVQAENIHLIGYGDIAQQQHFFSNIPALFRSASFCGIAERKTSLRGIEGLCHFYTENTKINKAFSYQCPLLGDFQHDNLVAALLAVHCLTQKPLQDVAECARQLPGIPGRLQLVSQNPAHPVVLVDYAHKPDALEKTLQTIGMLQSNKEKNGKLICIFGCGGDRDTTKRPIMGSIAAKLADEIIVTSDNPRTENADFIVDSIISGIPQNKPFTRCVNRRQAIQNAIETANSDDIIVIAGKGHEDYQIIGTEKFHFDDCEEAEVALKNRDAKRNL